MTKPIIVVKICYKLLYVIQVVKKIFDTVQHEYLAWVGSLVDFDKAIKSNPTIFSAFIVQG